jgi:hypothetical protein
LPPPPFGTTRGQGPCVENQSDRLRIRLSCFHFPLQTPRQRNFLPPSASAIPCRHQPAQDRLIDTTSVSALSTTYAFVSTCSFPPYSNNVLRGAFISSIERASSDYCNYSHQSPAIATTSGHRSHHSPRINPTSIEKPASSACSIASRFQPHRRPFPPAREKRGCKLYFSATIPNLDTTFAPSIA